MTIMPKISIYYVYHAKTNYNYWKPNIITNCPETLKVCYGILSKLNMKKKRWVDGLKQKFAFYEITQSISDKNSHQGILHK